MSAMLARDFIASDDRKFTSATTSKSAWYFIILMVAKLLRCVGIYFMDIIARSSHIVTMLFLYKSISALILVPVQKPFSHGKSLRKHVVLRIAHLALANCFIETCWLYALTLCGPLRSILVFEMSPSVLAVGVSYVMKGSGSPAKSRGVLCIVAGVVSLLLMDRDESMSSATHSESHAHHTGLNRLFYSLISLVGVPDHQGGIILLIALLVLRIMYDSSFRHLSVELGGSKRLHALVSLFSAVFLAPLSLLMWTFFSSESLQHIPFWEYLTILVASALFVFVIDFYAETICYQHVADPVMTAARWSPLCMFASALSLAWLVSPSEGAHPLSTGLLFTTITFSLGCVWVTSEWKRKGGGGHLVGMSDNGVPLYTHGEPFLRHTTKNVVYFAKETLREILSNSDSRRIFWFLLVNVSFCGVEFLYGFWTNSLGLISDAFHMLFDCSALVMGLLASVMSRWPATKHYSYGYGRVEVLSGFINALFLNVIATFILLEAYGRLWDPPKVNTDRLLIVAVIGLCVNLFGMFSLHSGDDGHGHSHHGHSHAHGHSHGGGNANMQGVFLHVLADTLGSVFVIISSLVMDYVGWAWMDPLCSSILSFLIIGSSYPLLKSSANTLLQDVPGEVVGGWERCLYSLLSIPSVSSYSNAHVWQLKSDMTVASIHVQCSNDANLQALRHKVTAALKEVGVTQCSVQVSKESFERRMREWNGGWSGGEKMSRANAMPPAPAAHPHSHSH